IIMMFFAIYIVLFVIDQDMNVIDAIKHGIRMSMATPGQTVLLLVLVYVVNFIGGMVCGIGTLVSTPLSALAIAWLYRSQMPMVPRAGGLAGGERTPGASPAPALGRLRPCVRAQAKGPARRPGAGDTAGTGPCS